MHFGICTGFDEAVAPCYILSLPVGGPIGHNKDQQSTNNTSQRKQWGKETRWYFPSPTNSSVLLCSYSYSNTYQRRHVRNEL